MSQHTEFEKLSQQRNNFYHRQYRRVMKVLLFLIALSGVLALALFFLMWTAKPANYYASTTSGDVVQLQPLSAPVVTQDYVIQWSELVVRSAYNLNFSSYEEQLKKTSPYFTEAGWQSFNDALKNSGLLDTVIAKKLYLTAVINGDPVIVNRYVKDGRFNWEVQLPVLISYTSANMVRKQEIYVSMTVTRVPELEDPRGIAVSKFYNGARNVR